MMRSIARIETTFLTGITMLTLLLSVPIQAQSTGDVVIGEPYVTEIVVDDVAQTVIVRGELGDSCTELGTIQQVIEASTIEIQIETTRPADAMCAMMLATFEETISLDTEGLAAGAYTIIAHGVTAPLQIADQAIICSELEAQDEQSLFTNDRICFLYPQEYGIVSNDTLILASSTEVFEGQRVALVIQSDPEPENTTLEAITEQLAADFPGMEEWNTERIQVSGEEALVTDSITGMRYLALLHDGTLYTVILQPSGGDRYPEAQQEAERFWKSFITTLGFIADDPSEE